MAALPALAADVLKVMTDPTEIEVTQSRDTHTFLPKDYLCVWRGDEEIACGIVKEILPKSAVIKLDFQKRNVKSGDKVYFAGNRYPAVAARSDNSIIEMDTSGKYRRRKYPFELSVGYIGSTNYQFPFAHFQGMVATSWAVGLQSQLATKRIAAGQLKVTSGILTVNYYGSSYFRGLWLQAGAGMGYLQIDKTAGGNESGTALVGVGTLGGRFGLFGGVNLGVGVGAQYLSQPSTLSVTLDFPTWQAVGTIDIGINF